MRTELLARSWETTNTTLAFSASPAEGPAVGARGGQKAHRCPACNSIIYSRRHSLCGVCGKPLPEDRLFTLTEAKAVTRLLSMEKQRYREWLSKGVAQALAILV